MAGALRLEIETVKSWPKRGIPARYWHEVVALVAPKMPDLTIEDLARSRPVDESAERAIA